MSPEEKEMLKELCKEDGLSMAQWIRRAINREYIKSKSG